MLELKAQIRSELGKKVKHLRKAGEIPAVLYGRNIKSTPLKVKEKDFQSVYQEAGESSIIVLRIGDEKKNVLISDLARDPLTDEIIHIDFYKVRMDEKITAAVPLEFIGVSPAVKEEEGVLIKNMHEIEIEALPQDLPHQIEVDISSLKEFHDNICVKDLSVSSKARVLAEPEEIVASVIPPRKEEEAVPVEETAVPEGEEAPEEAPAEEAAKEEKEGEPTAPEQEEPSKPK